MHRDWLKTKLVRYNPPTPEEQAMKHELLQFVENHPNCFDRELPYGHIVGSAWVINQNRDKALLTHHLKLNRWVQMGGHSDGHHITLEVALREAKEESGLTNLRLLSEEIFDLDVHSYPARQTKFGYEPTHLHFDLRFLFEANEAEPLNHQEEESHQVAWIPLNQLAHYTDEEAVLRMGRKTHLLYPTTVQGEK